MNCWHLTFAAEGRHAPFPDEATRRVAVRALARAAGAHLVLFCLVDDHLHVVVLCDRAKAGVLARAIVLTLRPLSQVPFRPAHISAVESRSHLETLVRYLLVQPEKHGLQGHPALWSGSCFADLVGARLVPDLALRTWHALPRLRLRSTWQAVGLPEVALVPMDDAAVRAAGAARIVSAAAAATAVGPALKGRGADVVAARRSAASLAVQAGIGLNDLAWALDVTVRGARKLAAAPPDHRAERATRLRLALEDAVAAAPRRTPTAP